MVTSGAAIKKAAIGCDLRFILRLELGGNVPPDEEVVARLNAALATISEQLRLT